MSKARETIGFGIIQNESPGVFSEKIVERKYYVDKTFDSRKYDQNNSINGSIDLSNKFIEFSGKVKNIVYIFCNKK